MYERTLAERSHNVTSEPTRDPLTDPLLTPQNCALVVIDYQPSQVQTVSSIDHELLTRNIVSVARIAKAYGLPIVLSTVNVAANGQPPTIPELREVLSDLVEIDRTQINSWEDVEFRRAVEATGRKKLVMTALWTEVCLAFPTLDALREGFEVFPVVDAVGGTSPEAHRAGIERIVQAGAQPISWVSLACELQRDWARIDTVPDVVDIVLTSRLIKGV
jgi:nicotinamidase-related amidase